MVMVMADECCLVYSLVPCRLCYRAVDLVMEWLEQGNRYRKAYRKDIMKQGPSEDFGIWCRQNGEKMLDEIHRLRAGLAKYIIRSESAASDAKDALNG